MIGKMSDVHDIQVKSNSVFSLAPFIINFPEAHLIFGLWSVCVECLLELASRCKQVLFCNHLENYLLNQLCINIIKKLFVLKTKTHKKMSVEYVHVFLLYCHSIFSSVLVQSIKCLLPEKSSSSLPLSPHSLNQLIHIKCY